MVLQVSDSKLARMDARMGPGTASARQICRIGMLALSVGAGLLIGFCGIGTASASTGDSSTPPVTAVSVSNAHSAVQAGRASLAGVSAGPARPSRLGTGAAKPAVASVGSRQPALVSPLKVVAAQTSNPAVGTAAITTAPSPGDTIYGNLSNAKYWQNQGNTNTCVLMSTAMVIGQLTGKMPTQDRIVQEAGATPSVLRGKGVTTEFGTTRTRNGMVYEKSIDEFVYYADSLEILFNNKITATATYYTEAQSARALSDLEAALRDRESVIVSISSDVRDTVVQTRGAFTGGIVSADHAVTVLAVNVTKGEVYINDTALSQKKGNYLTLSFAQFFSAWKPGRYTLITATLADPANPPTAPAQWKLVA